MAIVRWIRNWLHQFWQQAAKIDEEVAEFDQHYRKEK